LPHILHSAHVAEVILDFPLTAFNLWPSLFPAIGG
jgi:hypothetical protein